MFILLSAQVVGAQRLGGGVVPEHYSLWFGPELSSATFAGLASIRVRVLAPTAAITLHAAELVFDRATVSAGGVSQQARVTFDARAETATLSVARPLPAGAVTIDIAYSGQLNNKLRGFYLSETNGRRYAVSQMEATDARRAFPSFDEPVYKATFDISLTIDVGDVAISNGRQVSDTPGPGGRKHTVRFARTTKMSTYLVALLVGDFACRTGGSDGTVIRVCATPDKLPLTAFALEAAEHQLAFYNRYFGIRYPFGKLDIIGVPDFAAGAMENAGAITFRERTLLVDPARAAPSTLRATAAVISHEIAHQWFGNLVTMAWWDDIWLNEGFATWAEHKPLALWKPAWRVELNEAADTQLAIGTDAQRSTRAIRQRVETPDEINEVFDSIAYEKTAGVLRMIEEYVGLEPFQQAVRSYVRRHAFANAAGEDFWSELARVTGKPVDRVLRSYVTSTGTPVLSVEARCVQGVTELTLTQERFVVASEAAAQVPSAPESLPGPWVLPVCFRQGTGAPRCEILDAQRRTFPAPGCAQTFVNAEGRGFYVTAYTPETVRALAAAPGTLTPVERLSLLGDEWRMVQAGRHDVDVYLDLALAFGADETPAVLAEIADRLAYVDANIANPSEREAFRARIRARFRPVLDTLGLPGRQTDDDDRQRRRAILLSVVGEVGGDGAVRQQALALARAYLESPTAVPPALTDAVLNVAATSGDMGLFDAYVAKMAVLTAQPEEYGRFRQAMGRFADPAVVARVLDLALSPAVRAQDAGFLVGALLRTRATQERAWEFAQNRWTELTAKLDGFSGLPAVVTRLDGFCTAERRREVAAFFEARPQPAVARTLQQALERIDACVALDARQSEAFGRWLARN